jgi:hypothetical protein
MLGKEIGMGGSRARAGDKTMGRGVGPMGTRGTRETRLIFSSILLLRKCIYREKKVHLPPKKRHPILAAERVAVSFVSLHPLFAD